MTKTAIVHYSATLKLKCPKTGKTAIVRRSRVLNPDGTQVENRPFKGWKIEGEMSPGGKLEAIDISSLTGELMESTRRDVTPRAREKEEEEPAKPEQQEEPKPEEPAKPEEEPAKPEHQEEAALAPDLVLPPEEPAKPEPYRTPNEVKRAIRDAPRKQDLIDIVLAHTGQDLSIDLTRAQMEEIALPLLLGKLEAEQEEEAQQAGD